MLLDRLRAGELTLMLGIRMARTADVVRIASSAGHHAVMVDLEHSTIPLETAAHLCATADDLGMTALVRLPEGDRGTIGRVLDCGAEGIVAPRVETAAEAAAIVAAARFPPAGHRSQLAAVPQLGMRPTPAKELNEFLDLRTIVMVLVESPLGIANVDAIAAVAGVDIVGIGANDLSAELGFPGVHDDPRLHDAIATTAAACRQNGKLLMVGGIGDLETMARLVPLGVCPLFLTGMDSDLLYSAVDARAREYAAWYGRRTVGTAPSAEVPRGQA